ncbi:MAG: hypothetical protein BMS9Abin07_1934 [Acidimicrobiia bacterium]|nr:MAG: hypothetical protein BMS9Abin07_1934 [Acidimicrobiia bacterium]
MTTAGSDTTDEFRLITGRWAEVIVALILSATAVATAFSAFQAGKWGGAMTVAFNEAALGRTIAATDIAQASRDISGDRATFSSYVLALASGDDTSAAILFEEFRDEVKPLIEAWVLGDPLNNPEVRSPFDDPSYSVIGTVDDAVVALDEAEAFTTIALEGRANVGNYTLLTVVFAVVLFLAGLSRQFRSRPVSIALGVVSVVLLVVGIVALIALPTLI